MTKAKAVELKAANTAPTRLTRARRTALLKALADPNRFELLEKIGKSACPFGCSQAQSALAVSPATISHHVKELESAGLIRIERAGKFHLLHLQPKALEALATLLGSLARPDRSQA